MKNLALAALVSLFIVPLHGRTGIRILEARAFDLLSTIQAVRPDAPGSVIVAIDEPSFAELNERWPWSRQTHARLVEALKAAGAKSVGLDIVFAEPSDPQADEALAKVLDERSVLAADREVITMEHGTQVSRVGPLPRLLESGATYGITSVDLDSDGALRRIPTAEDSFSKAILAANGQHAVSAPSRGLIQFFGGPRTYPTVSYYQALEPQRFLPPGFFRDKTVLVGLSLKAAPTADAAANDAFQTPFTMRTGTLTAGVEVHATLVDNLRERLWIRPAPALAIALLVILGAVVGAGTGQATSWRTSLFAVLSLVCLTAASFTLLRFGRIWLPPVTPALAAVMGFGCRFAIDYTRERQLRSAVSKAFSRYVSPELVDELVRNPNSLRLGGETRELTVLFCDVRGFTSLSETLKEDPARLTTIINRLLDALSEQVLSTRGTIDKYMGDCVMAFWNAPLPTPNHAAAAVGAALRMIEAVERLNKELQAEDPNLPRLAVGVGVNTGLCVVGNIGSRWRYDYSVLGDAVNLASRLESATKEFGVPILLGEETASYVTGEFDVREIARIAVKGRITVSPIFEVSQRGAEASSRRQAASTLALRAGTSR